MGQKINPTGFRLAVSRNWNSRWFATGDDFGRMLAEDTNRAQPVQTTVFDQDGDEADARVRKIIATHGAFLFAAVLPYMAVRFLAFRAEVRMHQVGIYVAVMGGLLSLIPIVGLYMRAYGPALVRARYAELA